VFGVFENKGERVIILPAHALSDQEGGYQVSTSPLLGKESYTLVQCYNQCEHHNEKVSGLCGMDHPQYPLLAGLRTNKKKKRRRKTYNFFTLQALGWTNLCAESRLRVSRKSCFNTPPMRSTYDAKRVSTKQTGAKKRYGPEVEKTRQAVCSKRAMTKRRPRENKTNKAV